LLLLNTVSFATNNTNRSCCGYCAVAAAAKAVDSWTWWHVIAGGQGSGFRAEDAHKYWWMMPLTMMNWWNDGWCHRWKIEWNSNFGGRTSVETWIYIYLVRLNVSTNSWWASLNLEYTYVWVIWQCLFMRYWMIFIYIILIIVLLNICVCIFLF
jgi:hypothetical protein